MSDGRVAVGEWVVQRIRRGPDLPVAWTVVSSRTWTPHPAAGGYLRAVADVGRAAATQRVYAGRLAGYLNWLADTGLDWTLGVRAAARYMRHLEATPGPRGPRSGGTVNEHMTTLAGFYTWAGRVELVEAAVAGAFYETRYLRHVPVGLVPGEAGAPAAVAARTLRVPEETRAVEWLEDEQVAVVRVAPLSARDRFAFELLLETGMRVGEMLGLHIGDCHFTASSVEFGCHRKGPHVHIRHRPNPNDASAKSRRPRAVPVTAPVVQTWGAYLAERAGILGVDDDNAMVFVNLYRPPLGAAMRYSNMKKIFERISTAAGFPVRPHMLRHTAATRWKRAQVPDADSQALLGHVSPASMGVYQHADDADLRDAIERTRAGLSRREAR